MDFVTFWQIFKIGMELNPHPIWTITAFIFIGIVLFVVLRFYIAPAVGWLVLLPFEWLFKRHSLQEITDHA